MDITLKNGLIITPESIEDAEDIYKNIGCDKEMSKYTGWNPYFTLESTIEKVEADLKSKDSYSWVIRKSDEFVGIVGAYDYASERKSIEIGYSIVRDFWGKGYGKCAVEGVLGFLRTESEIKMVRAWSHKENIASIKILKGAGFVETEKKDDQIIYELKL